MIRVRLLCAVATMCVCANASGHGAAPRLSARMQSSASVIRVGIASPDGGYTIEALPLETYVARVLAGEAARGSRPAALEALAITLRTFALANLGRHRAEGFDLCDQTHCQVVRAATPATTLAAQATAGQILVRDGLPASIYYSASCGGRTELPSNVWPGADDPPFMPSQPDEACEGGPVWQAELSSADLQRALHSAGFRGQLGGMTIAARNSSGRVAQLRLNGLQPNAISGQDLRVAVGRTLGWQIIKSTAFEMRRDGNRYRFDGRGSGHGVGLCVIGAAHLAAAGESSAHILQRYFPGLDVAPVAALTSVRAGAAAPATAAAPAAPGAPTVNAVAPGAASRAEVVVSLPDGEDGARASVAAEVSAARAALARELGVDPPAVTVRVHPTVGDYERATGAPWFTFGALVRSELHLMPLGVLRSRGLVERTIRHQLARLMTGAALSGRDAWVRAGAAAYFADPRTDSAASAVQPPRPFRPGRPTSCPSDAELLRPVSIGALGNAYARARACFAHQIASGRSWREVK